MFELKENLEDELKTNEQYELFNELEMPFSLILADMESCGIKLEQERLQKMGGELNEQTDRNRREDL